MTEAYLCRSCQLTFEIGPRPLFGHTPFVSLTALVCSECGTMHRIMHTRRGEAGDCLSAQPGPITSTHGTDDWAGDTRQAWETYLCSIPPIDRRLGQRLKRLLRYIVDPSGRRTLSCFHCHAMGSLMSSWRFWNRCCPRCKEKTLEWNIVHYI